jgi:flagellar biosynthesis/type III secretory pathway chaperone
MKALEKKNDCLDQLVDLTLTQETLINDGLIEEEQFDQIIMEKDKLIQTVIMMDDGFDKIYQYVRETFLNNPYLYVTEKSRLKELVTEITDKSMKLQALENRNKNQMDSYFLKKRNEIKNSKISSKTVSSYYKNSASQYQEKSYFLDKKN